MLGKSEWVMGREPGPDDDLRCKELIGEDAFLGFPEQVSELSRQAMWEHVDEELSVHLGNRTNCIFYAN